MKRISIGLAVLIIAGVVGGSASALELAITYPSSNHVVKTDSAFIIGHTSPGARVTLNHKPVKLDTAGSFIQMVYPPMGAATYTFTAEAGGARQSKAITITRIAGNPDTPVTLPGAGAPDRFPIMGRIQTPRAVHRVAPGQSRLSPLPLDCQVQIINQAGGDYQIRLGSLQTGWVATRDVELQPTRPILVTEQLKTLRFSESSGNVLCSLDLPIAVPLRVDELSDRLIQLTLFGVTYDSEKWTAPDPKTGIKHVIIRQISPDTIQLSFEPAGQPFQGYFYYYDQNTLVFGLKKPPVIDPNQPLKAKVIVLDPGHGSEASGAVGLTGVPEKIINLHIAQYTKTILEERGAVVHMTRNSDAENPSLDARVRFAEARNADVLISIHNNALPDGENPFLIHGSSTFYYHPHSLALATSVQDALLTELKLKNDGINWGNLALCRATCPPAILVEVGYMINPDDYYQLITTSFQKRAATAIANGLERYFRQLR